MKKKTLSFKTSEKSYYFISNNFLILKGTYICCVNILRGAINEREDEGTEIVPHIVLPFLQ